MYEITQRQDYSDVTFMLEVAHPQLARAAQPGQFVMVMSHEHGERIPLTIADYDRAAGTLTLVIQAVGKTTREMQRDCLPGSQLFALVGPMGLPMQPRAAKTVVCVGGGLGVAPVFPQLRAYREHGARVIGIVGFRNEALAFWQERFAAASDDFILCTDDGSAGRPGFVSQALAEVLAREPVDEVVAIGPPAMMRACAEVARPRAVHTTVSLNPIMVDGTGMCGGCRVRVAGQMRFACVDGPDFDGHEVDWDELMARLSRFRRDEARANAHFEQHSCRLHAAVATEAHVS